MRATQQPTAHHRVRKSVAIPLLGGVVLAGAIFAVLTLTHHSNGHGVLDRAEKIPTSAIMTSRQLVAASVKSQRDALAPLVDSATPPGRLLPAGSALALVPMTWHQSGNFANAMADIHIPGEAQQKYELGFVRLSGSWRVTFIQGSS